MKHRAPTPPMVRHDKSSDKNTTNHTVTRDAPSVHATPKDAEKYRPHKRKPPLQTPKSYKNPQKPMTTPWTLTMTLFHRKFRYMKSATSTNKILQAQSRPNHWDAPTRDISKPRATFLRGFLGPCRVTLGRGAGAAAAAGAAAGGCEASMGRPKRLSRAGSLI